MFFLKCAHCGREENIDLRRYIGVGDEQPALCLSCCRPAMLLFKTERGEVLKIEDKAKIGMLRNPPAIIDKKAITVLLIQRGYRRFIFEEKDKLPIIVWALSDEKLRAEGWKPITDCWDENDIVHWDREHERAQEYDIDKAANKAFLDEPRERSPFDG